MPRALSVERSVQPAELPLAVTQPKSLSVIDVVVVVVVFFVYTYAALERVLLIIETFSFIFKIKFFPST